jgi:hypothetical protein
MLKNFFLSIIFLLFVCFFIHINIPIVVELSFFLNFLILFSFAYYNVKIEKTFSPFLSVFVVFNLLFFIVSPLVQINQILALGYGGGSFTQGFPYSDALCLRANLYILLFNIVFGVSYLYFKKFIPSKVKSDLEYKNVPFFLLILFVVSVLIFVLNFNSIIFQFQNDYYTEGEQGSVAGNLITQKFLYIIPLSGIIISYNYLKTKDKFLKNYFYVFLLFMFFLLTLLLLKNPLTEKRNALGPLYITLVFLFFRKILADNYKVLRFMFVAMLVFFPLMSILTHARFSMSQMIIKPSLFYKTIDQMSLKKGFNSLHYDAYSNFLATINYFDQKAVVYGEQLLCSVFFFVPRSIWESKPETTGFLIGNYLMDKYKFTFDNLSNPFISEGYINFGFFGIIVFAIVLAYFFIIMIKWLRSGDHLKSVFAFYFSIYLMFFLRGDLTNGIAFIVSFWLAVYVFPKIIFSVINYYAKSQKTNT